jgi:hypothetical protein
MNVDKFPEAFRRFERVVDTSWITSFDELRIEFESWAGEKWLDTSSQRYALAREARRVGIPTRMEFGLTPTWRHEFVIIGDISYSRYRDLRTGRFIKRP